MSIKPLSSTMGKSSPATVSVDAGGGGYRWRKNPDWEPGHPKYRDDRATPAESQQQNVARSGAPGAGRIWRKLSAAEAAAHATAALAAAEAKAS